MCNIEFAPEGLYNSVPSCLVTVRLALFLSVLIWTGVCFELHYYVGFCHMMMRRYGEAVRVFMTALLFIQRTRNAGYHQAQQNKSWQYDVISKTNEQLYQLLGICLVLQPQRIDESIHSQLNERLGDRVARMRKGELPEFEAAFASGCPKFLAPTVFSDREGNLSKEPLLHQSRVFKGEILEQVSIPLLRGYLSLYSSITVAKLASFMEVTEEELIGFLLSFKHKLADPSPDADEDNDNIVDLDFYVDKVVLLPSPSLLSLT